MLKGDECSLITLKGNKRSLKGDECPLTGDECSLNVSFVETFIIRFFSSRLSIGVVSGMLEFLPIIERVFDLIFEQNNTVFDQ